MNDMTEFFSKTLTRAVVALAFCWSPAFAHAMTPEEALEAYNAGEFSEAAPALRAIADREPKNALANTRAGIALMRSGNHSDARRYLTRGNNESRIYLAELDFYRYDLDGAEGWLEKFETAAGKARRAADKAEFKRLQPEAERVRGRIEQARSMMDRVEKVTVIDSISVDRDDFLRFYRLAKSAGSLGGASELPPGCRAAEPTVVYSSEKGDMRIWAEPDEEENYVLVQSSRLADGSWEPAHPLGEILNEGGDANYPFLMPDGVTLYFANDGENSLGGYDIFISRFDGEKYLQPQNMGMPYNSPYDDYMLAIDDETGIGWWATARNGLEDSVTIYRFIPQDLRINYPVDTPGLAGFAMLDNYRSTWDEGADFTDLNRRIDNMRLSGRNSAPDFHFALPDGSVRTSVDAFHSAQARVLMAEYLAEQDNLAKTRSRLAAMRERYRQGDTTFAQDILAMEEEVKRLRKHIAELRDAVVLAEI